MKNRNYTVLLTGTIDASVYNNVGNRITDISERLKQYEESISLYITSSAFTNIVFAENSGFPFEFNKFSELAELNGKKFEYIKCPSYIEDGIKYGKSFGEMMLINDALEKSLLLRRCEIFYKLTGRIFLYNSNKIVKTYGRHRNEFLVISNQQWCYSNIFKVAKEDYIKYFSDSYTDLKKNKRDIEFTYFGRVKKAYENGADIGSFNTWPHFGGIMGTTLTPYTGSWRGRCYHSLLCKMKAYQYGSVTSDFASF